MGKPVREKAKHAAAWELYYALGADRSLSEVARRFNTSPTAVHQWSVAFDWQKRLVEREKIVSQLVAQKAVEDEAQLRADALKICRASIIRYAQSLQPTRDAAGNIIAPATADIRAADFVNLVKLDRFLRGGADSRTELLIGGPVFDRLIDALAAVIEREVQDPALRSRLALGFQEAAESITAPPGNA